MRWFTFIGFVVYVVWNCNALGISRVDPLVDSNVGLIRGLLAEDGSYSMFLGIPYAKVDENNPFGPSTPYLQFEDTFEAYDDSSVCPQRDGNKNLTGTLDCLRVNVFVPRRANSQNKVPVMVYIHGGHFARGSGGRTDLGPKYLVRHDIILVTVNYRLGPYGFMCLDIPEVPGNQGLKDQVLALNWVKNNIDAFGGDSSKITVFGGSAGAHSVDFHLTYGEENLFQSAILQSGSALASTVIIEPDYSAPQKISEYLGMATESATEALTYLAGTDPITVIDAVVNLDMEFKPCIETEFDEVVPFITESWINAQTPKARGKHIMIGFNEIERYENFEPEEKYINNENLFREMLESTFDFSPEKLNEMEELVRTFYIGNEKVNEEKWIKWSLVKLDSDFTYIHPIQRSIRRYLENQARNIFYYMFSYVGERNYGQIKANITVKGAMHADEIGYLFDPVYFEGTEPTPEDQRLIDQMTTMWTNFAKIGDPTPETSELLPTKWTPLSIEDFYYLNIGSDLTVERRPVYKRMAFWNLFYMLNEKSQKLYADIE